jgi:hypothetical protein
MLMPDEMPPVIFIEIDKSLENAFWILGHPRAELQQRLLEAPRIDLDPAARQIALTITSSSVAAMLLAKRGQCHAIRSASSRYKSTHQRATGNGRLRIGMKRKVPPAAGGGHPSIRQTAGQ